MKKQINGFAAVFNGYVTVFLVAAFLGILVGITQYQFGWRQLQDNKVAEKETILRLTDSFVSTYSSVRSSDLGSKAPVPASFRAHALEQFNKDGITGDDLRIEMVGVPERSIKIEPPDEFVAEKIREFSKSKNSQSVYTITADHSGTVLRTLYPSLANKQSCVDCHNAIQGADAGWKIGDVMGAFVVDAQVGAAMRRIQRDAAFSGFAVFFLIGAVGAYVRRDFARKRRLNEQVKDSKQRFQILSELNADCFWEMDENLRYSYFSDTYKDTTGVDPQQMLGKRRIDLAIPDLSQEAFVEHVQTLERHEPFRDFVHSHTKEDGSVVWVSISGEPTFDDNGNFIKYLGTLKNITNRIQHEKDLEQAKHDAELADRAKSEFLANMSHEIRTPMNGVMGMAELLVKTGIDGKRKVFADTILKSSASLVTIINDILDFSKLDSGNMELTVAPFNLAEAIEDVATIVSTQVATKDLELAVRISPELPKSYLGDVGRLRQIVTNLVGNAVKFTDKGHVFVDVNGQHDGQGNVDLTLRIEDTGIGIPKEKCRHIFEKFSQVDQSATRKHDGTGLGLAISSSIVELMNGTISVDSEVGKGSIFTVKLTLAISEQQEKIYSAPIDMTDAKILIVDDNEVNRSILLEQMKAWKFSSIAASSGKEALGILLSSLNKGVEFDAIVLDYQMPEMDGADVVSALRAEARFKDIAVVMLTSVDQTQDGGAFSELDIQGHLVKPARSALLFDTIVSALQSSKSSKLSSQMTDQQMTEEKLTSEQSSENASEQADNTKSPSQSPHHPQHFDVLLGDDNQVSQFIFRQILERAGYSYEIATSNKDIIETYGYQLPKVMFINVSSSQIDSGAITQAIRNHEAKVSSYMPIIAIADFANDEQRQKCLATGMDEFMVQPISPERLEESLAKLISHPAQRTAS